MSIKPRQPASALSFPLVGGGTFDLASARIDKQLWVVVYRGKHCPLCRQQLEAIEALSAKLRDAGISVVAVSADPADRAEAVRAEWDIASIPLGHGLTEAQMRAWGLFVSDGISDKETARFAEPGFYAIQPDRTVYYVAVNSMPFGRPDPVDMFEKLTWTMGASYPARGEA